MDKRILVTALVSAIGGGVIGGAVTYITVKKSFAERAQRDIEDVKAAYAEMFDGKRVVNDYTEAAAEPISHIPGATLSDEQIKQAKEFAERLKYSTVPPDEVVSEEEIVVGNIYDRQETPVGREVTHPLMVNYDREGLQKARKPYLISSEEFMTTETEWDKLSITYYEDDDVLADENDKPIDNIDYLVGEKHLDYFGIDSGDKNIVFIRNGNISSDIEITRNLGAYTEIVLGVPKSFQTRPNVRRTRVGDDE